VSKFFLNNPGNFPLKLLSRFKDIEFFVVGSFLLPHPEEAACSDILVDRQAGSVRRSYRLL